ncbi:MAG: acyltransferase family protein [Hyphomicrobiaceae bacterium]|nr:acyltransferase family protein [Hyphomicrobiaceae bacterium]
MKYRADIDGLRAIAVLAVLLFHSHLPFIGGGFVGVDVFFVISGYVIAWRIVEDLQAKQFSILDFYVRRVRRIIPALLFTMLLSTAVALILLMPPAMDDFSRSLVATSTFVSNFYFWSVSGYFDASAQTRPLLHTWSLSVEEQFYVAIPVAMWLLYRFGRWMWIAFALAAAASFFLSVYVTDKAPSANFFLLPTRAWELLVGVLLVLRRPSPITNFWAREAVAMAGLCAILWAVFFYTEATPFPGAAALLPTVGAGLLIYVGQSNVTFASRILSWRPLVFVGLISYSLYLMHWPVAVFLRAYLLRTPNGLEILFSLIATFGLALFCWRWIERPFRRKAFPWGRPLILASTGAALFAVALVGVTGVATDGFRKRYEDFGRTAVKQEEWKVGTCFLLNQTADDWKGEDCMRTTGASVNAVLWGDSFAAHYIPGLLRNADRLDANIIQYTFAGCPPLLSYESFSLPGCKNFNNRIFDVIKRYDASIVVLSSRWDLLIQRGLGGLQETVDKLRAAGMKVYVIGQSPVFAVDVAVLSYRRIGLSADGSATWYSSTDLKENEKIRALALNVQFVDPLEHLCGEGKCTFMKDHSLLYSDYGHFSDYGSDWAVRSYFPLYRAEGVDRTDGAGGTVATSTERR